MKKVLACLFVCVAMTAMAVTPQFNNAKLVEGRPGKALSSKACIGQLSPAVNAGQAMRPSIVPGVSPLTQHAPGRQVAEDALLNSNPVIFGMTYRYDNQGDSMALTVPVYYGGWNVAVEKGENANDYNYYICLENVPHVIDIDLANNTARMQVGQMACFHWTDTVALGYNSYQYNDTTEYLYLYDEASLVNGTEPAAIEGTVGDDGSLHFADGWFVYVVKQVKTTLVGPGVGERVYNDTISGMLTDVIRDTWLKLPNGKHTFTYNQAQQEVDVYMHQQDDSTVVVWNLWGGGGRDYVMKVYGDGTMTFPFQAIQYGDFSAYEQNGMTFGDIMYNWGGDYMSQADTRGTASPAEIAWDKTYVATPVYKNGTTYPGYYGVGYEFTANKLNFTDGSSFLIGKTANPVVTYEVTDDAVIITVAVEPGADYQILVNGEPVTENPYTIARTSEDQVVTVQATAQAPGKNVSDVVEVEISVPAKVSTGLRGDVNGDGQVSITDAIVLLNAIQSGDWSLIDMTNANVNYDGNVNVTDAIQLINYISIGKWYDE